MSYIVLARKWRPLVFEDVVGQEHITQILMNALKHQRIAMLLFLPAQGEWGKPLPPACWPKR